MLRWDNAIQSLRPYFSSFPNTTATPKPPAYQIAGIGERRDNWGRFDYHGAFGRRKRRISVGTSVFSGTRTNGGVSMRHIRKLSKESMPVTALTVVTSKSGCKTEYPSNGPWCKAEVLTKGYYPVL